MKLPPQAILPASHPIRLKSGPTDERIATQPSCHEKPSVGIFTGAGILTFALQLLVPKSQTVHLRLQLKIFDLFNFFPTKFCATE
jgi:hypothetical protein